MSRTMKSAQQAIFGALDGFCAAAGPVANAGSPRWIRGTKADSVFLAGARISDLFRGTPRRMMARLDYRERTFFSTLGFQGSTPPAGLDPGETTPGLVSVLLAEASPRLKLRHYSWSSSFAIERRLVFKTLHEALRGNSSRKVTPRGTLNPASSARHFRVIASASRFAPARDTTNTCSASPHCASLRPTTATS